MPTQGSERADCGAKEIHSKIVPLDERVWKENNERNDRAGRNKKQKLFAGNHFTCDAENHSARRKQRYLSDEKQIPITGRWHGGIGIENAPEDFETHVQIT